MGDEDKEDINDQYLYIEKVVKKKITGLNRENIKKDFLKILGNPEGIDQNVVDFARAEYYDTVWKQPSEIKPLAGFPNKYHMWNYVDGGDECTIFTLQTMTDVPAKGTIELCLPIIVKAGLTPENSLIFRTGTRKIENVVLQSLRDPIYRIRTADVQDLQDFYRALQNMRKPAEETIAMCNTLTAGIDIEAILGEAK